MPLKLMYITNDPYTALAAEKGGCDRIWIDLETKGKEERQKNMNTVKSNHTISDIKNMSRILTKSELMVRINPWDDDSKNEIEEVVSAGADRIMLPMWKTAEEVNEFLKTLDSRTKNILLLETKEAVECLDEVLKNPLIDEIHIGLNDLHLSYGLDFMFELVADGTVERICKKIADKGILYGFGGIARIGEGQLPADKILCEHIRLKSSAVILSRSFYDSKKAKNKKEANETFTFELMKFRQKEKEYSRYSKEKLVTEHNEVIKIVNEISSQIRKARQ